MNRHAMLMTAVMILSGLVTDPRVIAAPAPAGGAGGAEVMMRKIEGAHGIKLPATPPPPSDARAPKLKFTPLTPRDHAGLEAALAMIDAELARYSAGLLRGSGLRTIALVNALHVGGELYPMTVDRKGGVLYFAIANGRQEWFVRRLFHHFIYLMIDSRLNGHLAADDPKWTLLNARGFRYGIGGGNALNSAEEDRSDAVPGFTSGFARTACATDKSDIFAALMIPAETKLVQQMARRDPIVRAKVAYVQSVIEYFNALPDTDEQRRYDELCDALRAKDEKRVREITAAHPEALTVTGWAKRTPLHLAVTFGTSNELQRLRVGGKLVLDLDAADEDGWTALHLAAIIGDQFAARALIDAGANVAAKDAHGGTPMDWARLRNHAETAEMIRTTRPRSGLRPAG